MLRINDEYHGKTKLLDADDIAFLLKELTDESHGTRALFDSIKSGAAVDLQLAYSILYVKESALSRVCKRLGIELDSATEREARYAEIREANYRIRDLEAELGRTVTAKHVQAALRVLADKLEHWWDVEGFGHIRTFSFTQWGSLEVVFSLHLFSDTRIRFLDKPASQKDAYAEWLDSLRNKGLKLLETQREEPSLVDCDSNRQFLEELFETTFPNARVISTENHYQTQNGERTSVLRTVKVIFDKLQDVEALPEKPAHT